MIYIGALSFMCHYLRPERMPASSEFYTMIFDILMKYLGGVQSVCFAYSQYINGKSETSE